MEADEALAKLKKEYPEIEVHILEEALRNNDFDFRRTSEALRARFYSEDAGIPQEESLWNSLAAPFGSSSAPQTSKANNSDWDLSLETLQEGVNAIGASLLMGVEAVADTLGSLGDLIPDLIFGEEEYYEDEDGVRQSRRERDQVVVGSSRGNAVKKRGTPHSAKPESPPPTRYHQEEGYATDEEGDDWTKED